MANSLKSKLSKLRYRGHITDDEYRRIIKKIDSRNSEVAANTRSATLSKIVNELPPTRSTNQNDREIVRKINGMREATKEERQSVSNYIDSISVDVETEIRNKVIDEAIAKYQDFNCDCCPRKDQTTCCTFRDCTTSLLESMRKE